MPTVAVVTRPRPNAEGELPVYLRLEHASRTRYVSMQLRASPKHWNARTGELRRTYPGPAHRLNGKLAQARVVAAEEADALGVGGRPFTADEWADAVRARLSPTDDADDDLGPWLRAWAEGYRRRGQLGTHASYRKAVDVYLAWAGRVTAAEIDHAHLQAYADHLRADYSTNSVALKLRILRAGLGAARRAGVVEAWRRPFEGLRITTRRPSKDALLVDEVRQLAAADLSDDDRAREARDAWVFAFWAGGPRYGDLARLTWSDFKPVEGSDDEWRVRFVQAKTGDEAGALLVPEARTMVEARGTLGDGSGYVFNLLEGRPERTPEQRHKAVRYSCTVTGRALQRAADAAGLDRRLTWHMARHSIARYLVHRGWSIYEIMHLLGHASVVTTQRYLRGVAPSDLDARMRSLSDGAD